jgi:hypothetical protein
MRRDVKGEKDEREKEKGMAAGPVRVEKGA